MVRFLSQASGSMSVYFASALGVREVQTCRTRALKEQNKQLRSVTLIKSCFDTCDRCPVTRHACRPEDDKARGMQCP